MDTYNAGYCAYFSNAPAQANPHSPGSNLWFEWLKGWDDAYNEDPR